MTTIIKKFTDYPFGHRQHNHEGHCANIHGHNWDFEIILGAEELDDNGFVFDFGKMDPLKAWLKRTFDHTLLLNEDDPFIQMIQGIEDFPAKIKIVRSCSCEGIARMLWNFTEEFVAQETEGRVHCLTATVYEDRKNSASYHNTDWGQE